MRFSCLSILTLVGALTIESSVAAQSYSRLSLIYEAPLECPNRDEFWRGLVARSLKPAWAQTGAPAVAIDARIAKVGAESYVGRLRVADGRGEVVQRELAGATCEQVSAALSLIAAVALDDSVGVADVPVPPRQKESKPTLSLGPIAGVHSAIANEAAPVLGVSGAIQGRSAVVMQEYRFEAFIGWSRRETIRDNDRSIGNSRFSLLATRTSACPLQVRLATTTVGPCVLLELGALYGKASSADGQRSASGWWVAPGAMLNWTWQIAPIGIRAGGGVVRPLVRDTFRFDPTPMVFRPPSLGVIAEVQLAWLFL